MATAVTAFSVTLGLAIALVIAAVIATLISDSKARRAQQAAASDQPISASIQPGSESEAAMPAELKR